MRLFSKHLGDVPVPGEVTLALPAGKIKVDYDEQRKGRSTEDGSGDSEWPGLPAGLEVAINPAAGGTALTIEPGRMQHEYATFRRIGSRVGAVEIPTAGDYTIRVTPVPSSARELYEPTIKLKT
jgi:hypothetical protein